MRWVKAVFISLLFILYANATTIEAEKDVYQAGESITVTVTDMAGGEEDWIGIYPAGTSNDWDNVVSWAWTGGIVNGQVTLDGVNSAGNYEIRAFFNNSFHMEAQDIITVQGNIEPSIESVKDTYDAGEDIVVDISNAAGNQEDWVGVYPVGASNDWENVVSWAWTGGIVNGRVTLEGVPAGNYEVRLFFNNSFNVEATDTITVRQANLPPTVYEDGEDGTTNGWFRLSNRGHISNMADGANSARSIMLWGPYWQGGGWGEIDYKLYLNNNMDPWNNRFQHILEFDIKTHHSWEPCFYFELPLQTTEGRRVISFDTYIPHTHQQESRRDMGDYVQLSFGIAESYRWGRVWKHVRLDLQEYVNRFEPNNVILSVDGFVFNTRGGDYLLDNIRLVSE